ncbi:SDR family oxidoreductase [Chitinophagaceae bacterium LB-8]|uniref:SDR family oxidoreductase n=1 Tax=Paraflavisolibacter caeni TaxID=2982496 RepID=A0A9X2Y1G6_9BACT|nr:SDR family oxidoreductase [Paraflavisolibacter caeni]MCU7551508.1 SDR family oxidoreductase [Paraflavisolibacter caeni]
MITIDLKDKTILMTGALSGIADYVIKTLIDANATLILTDKCSIEEAYPILKARGLSNENYFAMDVTDANEVRETIKLIFKKWPDINVGLGHAGGTGIKPFLEASTLDFYNLVNFNFLGQAYFAHAIANEWVERQIHGHLIFTSSFVSSIPMEGITAYTSSKAGLEMLMKNLALEFSKYKIRVNAVSPGNVAVGKSKELYDNVPDYRAWVDRVSPLGARNTPEAIANAFAYLCSPLANELHGHALLVDNGVGLPKLG